jgi:hypothetical protein
MQGEPRQGALRLRPCRQEVAAVSGQEEKMWVTVPMSPAKGTKARGEAFHLIMPRSTEFMSFKVELCGFCTRTSSSLCMVLQGGPWLCFPWGLGPDPDLTHC